MSNPLAPKHRKGMKYDDSSGGLPEWIQSDDAVIHDALRKTNKVMADSGKVGKKQIEHHKTHKGFDALTTHQKHHYNDCDADSHESSTKKVHAIGDIEESASLTYGNHIYDDGNPGGTLLADPCDELAPFGNAETCEKGLGTISELEHRHKSGDKGDVMLSDTGTCVEGDVTTASPLPALLPTVHITEALEKGSGNSAEIHTQPTDKDDGNKANSTLPMFLSIKIVTLPPKIKPYVSAKE